MARKKSQTQGQARASSKPQIAGSSHPGIPLTTQGQAQKGQNTSRNKQGPKGSRQKSTRRAAVPVGYVPPRTRRRAAEDVHESLSPSQLSEPPKEATVNRSISIKSQRRSEASLNESTRRRVDRLIRQSPPVDPIKFWIDIHGEVQRLESTLVTTSSENLDFLDAANKVFALAAKVRQYGYEPLESIGDMAEAGSIANFTEAIKEDVLESSNVDLHEDKGDDLAQDRDIRKYITEEKLKSKEETESRWKADLKKCANSPEAVYQRTLMDKMIDRHNFEKMKTHLDFTNEVQWRSTHPPSRPDTRLLPSPLPDLCVGFRRQALLPGNEYLARSIPLKLKQHIRPETLGAGDEGRDFPFLMVEVKGPASDFGGRSANIQSVNDAAHALYNIWQFVEGNPELEHDFFSKVRVFTASGNSKEFWVRSHRAERIPEGGGRVYPDYPLGFRYKVMDTVSGTRYTHAYIRDLTRNVMEWGIEHLLPTLQDAVKYICSKAEKDAKNTSLEVYRSQQPGRGRSRGKKGASVNERSSTTHDNYLRKRSAPSPQRNRPTKVPKDRKLASQHPHTSFSSLTNETREAVDASITDNDAESA